MPELRVAIALLALVLALGLGSSGGANAAILDQEFHFFEISVNSRGYLKADWGHDLKPGLTTAAGVDGKAELRWHWTMKAAAVSIGDGPVRSTAAIFRGEMESGADVFSYTVQMGVPDIDPLCRGSQDQNTVSGPSPGGSSYVYRPDAKIRLHGNATLIPAGFNVHRPFDRAFDDGACLHSVYEDGLKYFDDFRGAPVPRGAFNPRFDRYFSKTYQSNASHPRGSRGDHSAKAASKVTITIRAIPEHRYRKHDSNYRHHRRGRVQTSPGPILGP